METRRATTTTCLLGDRGEIIRTFTAGALCAHATPGSDARTGQRLQIAALQFPRIDVALNTETQGLYERSDVVDSESVDVAESPPPVRQPTRAVAAVIAVDERSRHIVEQNAAAWTTVRSDQRENRSYRGFRKVVRDAFPQKQCPHGGRVAALAQRLSEIFALEIDRHGDRRR